MKILIICLFFPPRNSIASLRPYSWAKYWSRMGHDVTVVTTPKKYHPSNIDLPFDGFRVIEVDVPLVRFLRKISSKNYFSHENAQVRGREKSGFLPCVVQSIQERWRKIKAKYGIFYAIRMPDILDFYWSRRVIDRLKNKKFDLIVSTAGPYGVHAPAYHLKKKGLTKHWIADWRDLWTDNHMFPGIPGFRKIERFLEKKWCESADVITTVSEPLAEILRAKYGNKVSVIFNGFDEEDYLSLPAAKAFPDDGVSRILYTGTIYPKFQDPSPLFSAIFELHQDGVLKPGKLQVLFCGLNSNVTELAESMGVGLYVRYLGFLPRTQALHLQRDATALLLLEVENKEVKGVLTGKLFEYLFAGPPVITIGVTRGSGIGELLEKTGSGKAFGRDVSSIKSFLKELTENYGRHANKPENKEEILKYSRREQARLMLELVSG